jgi:hypothetical protein
VPQEIRRSVKLWVGVCRRRSSEPEYQHKLKGAGFESIEIEATRIYSVNDAREFLGAAGIDVDAIAPQVESAFISVFVRTKKPKVISACCGPSVLRVDLRQMCTVLRLKCGPLKINITAMSSQSSISGI